MDIDRHVHEYFNKYSQMHTLKEVQVGCDWLRTTLTAVDTEAEARGREKEATRRDGIEHAVEQSIIDQHVTIARADELKNVLEKLHSMYVPAGFDELSGTTFHRMGYNLSIDDLIRYLTK